MNFNPDGLRAGSRMIQQAALLRLGWMWVTAVVALWVADGLFDSIWFDGPSSLAISALLLTLVNLTLKPMLMLLSLPFIVMSLGLAIPLVNGLVLLVVAEMVNGFHVSGYWMAVLAALFVSFMTFLMAVASGQSLVRVRHAANGGPSEPAKPSQNHHHGSESSKPGRGWSSQSQADDVIDVEVKEKDDRQ